MEAFDQLLQTGVKMIIEERSGSKLGRLLLSGLLLASVSAVAINRARADDSVTVQEVRDLKARLKQLEKRLDAQGKEQKKLQANQAAAPRGTPVAYEPPQPWDKKWHMNGITITPGGFFAAEGVWRSRDQGADIGDLPFGSIPAENTGPSRMNEARFSARQSRVSALVEGDTNPSTHVSGYGELDFLGAANTANSNESNSYNPRIRNLYATVDWNDIGVHVLAGQSWSLATMTGKGIAPRSEMLPPTIDAQYVAGFTWARQPGVRLTKNFGNDVWVAVSAEQAQTTGCPGLTAAAGFAPAPASPTVASGFAGLNVTCAQQSGGGGLLDSETTYSINHVPDVIGKVAWEPMIADRKIHFEGFGMYRDLYDQVDYLNGAGALTGAYGNRDTTGWGVGGGVIVPVMPKLLDLQGTVLAGRGIGRYGSGQLADATLNPDGSLRAIPEIMFLGGATLHATPSLDIYAFGGMEREFTTYTATTATAAVGIGDPSAITNTGCYTVGGTCTAQTKDVFELTAGIWDKVYEGNFGSLRVGIQYSYIQRDFFAGSGGLPAGSAPIGAKTNENSVLTSLRYYPFDAAPPAPPLIAKY